MYYNIEQKLLNYGKELIKGRNQVKGMYYDGLDLYLVNIDNVDKLIPKYNLSRIKIEDKYILYLGSLRDCISEVVPRKISISELYRVSKIKEKYMSKLKDKGLLINDTDIATNISVDNFIQFLGMSYIEIYHSINNNKIFLNKIDMLSYINLANTALDAISNKLCNESMCNRNIITEKVFRLSPFNIHDASDLYNAIKVNMIDLLKELNLINNINNTYIYNKQASRYCRDKTLDAIDNYLIKIYPIILDYILNVNDKQERE